MHFSFIGEEINSLIEFIMATKAVPMDGSKRYLTDDEVRSLVLSHAQKLRLLEGDPDLIAEIVKNTPDLKADVIAVGYRRGQLAMFRTMLDDSATDEPAWQAFFERNQWIFGYGLAFQFLGPAYADRLEQTVSGFDVTSPGKRVDALMKTMGQLSSLCFVEIKRANTALLGREYRSGAWAPSDELSGAVAQVQTTVNQAMYQIREKLEPKGKDGWSTGETLYNYEPRSHLVVGNLSEFADGVTVNTNQLRSFELYRRNTWRPEIVTFDELYERAKFIVGGEEITKE
jgi:hypothetical protein